MCGGVEVVDAGEGALEPLVQDDFFGFKDHRAKISLESIKQSLDNVVRCLRRSIEAC